MSKEDLNKVCPTCGAEIGFPCVSKTGRVAQDVHQSRLFGVARSRKHA